MVFSKAFLAGATAGILLSACSYPEATLTVPTPDAKSFESEVYPLLLRDCAFSECHGAEGRFFRVYGPGRTRISPPGQEVLPYDPVTSQEIDQTYGRARSMLSSRDGIEQSLLLRKPLARAAGGAGHKGEDSWGRNVYATRDDPAYVVLSKWALTAAQTGQGN
jgi:hypothetical protein